MAKKSKNQMTGRQQSHPAATRRPVAESSASPSKKRRPAGNGESDGVSGDVLDDNFLVETLDAGSGGAALDDTGDEMDLASSTHKKRKHDELKEKKKARAVAGPRREDSAVIASASVEAKAEFFLVHARSPAVCKAQTLGDDSCAFLAETLQGLRCGRQNELSRDRRLRIQRPLSWCRHRP